MVFLYDGDCAFCTSCARWLQRRVPTVARIEPWQFVDIAALGVTVAECETAVQWIGPVPGKGAGTQAGADGGQRHLQGPAAIAALLRTSTLRWRIVGAVLATAPVSALAGPVYRWVARHRDRMPGGTAACAVPADHRSSSL